MSQAPATEAAVEGLARAQDLAYRCAKAIAAELDEGWTEAQAARLMDVYFRDHGVRHYFHTPFAWFGDRTRFDGMSRWRHFLPGGRVLRPGEAVILDAAPLVDGWPADIGYSTSLGANPAIERARRFLAGLRAELPRLIDGERGIKPNGARVAELIAARVWSSGWDVVHHRYPGGVLGHRLRPASARWQPPTFIPFGWTALKSVLVHGPREELLNEAHRGPLTGVWAIEPHLGGRGFGCKFEEVLLVDLRGARWLSPEAPW